MLATIGAFEAKRHFSELVDRVAKGEEIIITRHGTPVAKLVPVTQPNKRDIRAVVERFKEIRKILTLSGISWKELRDEGRK